MHLSDLILIKKEGEYFYLSGKMFKNKFQSMIFLQLKAFFVEILNICSFQTTNSL